MAYKKILQLRRSTNIWLTKNMAKAEVERNAKNLHPEYGVSFASAKDGEPIVARYYDELPSGVSFSYEDFSGDPYVGGNSCDHIWVDGFDSFAVLPDASNVNANSAAYIRIGSGSNWTYKKLVATSETTPIVGTGISSIFGVAYKSDAEMYIEWFDSAEDAEAILKKLNVNDTNVVKGFVAAVKQKNGLIEPIHGTLSSEKAINITERAYTYVKLAGAPADWKVADDNHGASLPDSPTIASPKYFLVEGASESADNGYYELQKDIRIDLVIDDDLNNILSQNYVVTNLGTTPVTGSEHLDVYPNPITASTPEYFDVTVEGTTTYYHVAHGLSTNLNLRELTSDEITALHDSNVKEAYKLVGIADGTEKQIGATIKIYKDSALYRVYLGHVDDTLDNTTDPPTVVDGDGNDALCFIYHLADGTYSLVAVDVESFLMENEFKDGLEIKQGYRYGNCAESEVTSGYVWDASNTFNTQAEAEAVVATASSLEFLKWGSEGNWTYLKKEHQGEVYVKLDANGGIEFKTPATVGENSPIGIKIDATNTYFKYVETGATHTKNVMYEWVNGSDKRYTTVPNPTTATPAYIADPNNENVYTLDSNGISAVTRSFDSDGNITVNNVVYTANGTTKDGYIAASGLTSGYKLVTYLYTDVNGLGVDEDVLKNRVESEMANKLKVNGQGFEKNASGELEAKVTSNDIKVAEDTDTIPQIQSATYVTAMPLITDPTGYYIYNNTPYYNDGTTVAVAPAGLYEANGVIYTSNGTTGKMYDPTTDVITQAQANAISMYLTYNLDMGTYTI